MHLLFLNRIREQQPDKPLLQAYFADRHWRHDSLASFVALGMQLGEGRGEPFTWLASTNKGAAEICQAALEHLGDSEKGMLAIRLLSPTCLFWPSLV